MPSILNDIEIDFEMSALIKEQYGLLRRTKKRTKVIDNFLLMVDAYLVKHPN
jgi:hypothetical protein